MIYDIYSHAERNALSPVQCHVNWQSLRRDLFLDHMRVGRRYRDSDVQYYLTKFNMEASSPEPI